MRTSLLTIPLVLGCLASCSHAASSEQSLAAPTAPSVTPEVRQETPPSDAPWLVYQGDGAGRTEVRLIRTDGRDAYAPVAALDGGDQTNPDWDPTGSRLTFAMNDGSTDDLWVSDPDGGHARRLLDCVAPCLYVDDPSWSPGGQSIVVSRTVSRHGAGVSTLEVVDVASGRTTTLVGPMTHRFTAGARWSPDGRWIVFELVRKAGPGVDDEVTGVTLSTIRVHGAEHRVRSLTDPTLFAATADWSPDGRWIVYSALATASDRQPDLFLVRPGGGEPRRLTRLARHEGYAAEPTFTPDGTSIVFSGRFDSAPGAGLLLTVGLDGSSVRSAFGTDLVHGRHPRLQPTA